MCAVWISVCVCVLRLYAREWRFSVSAKSWSLSTPCIFGARPTLYIRKHLPLNESAVACMRLIVYIVHYIYNNHSHLLGMTRKGFLILVHFCSSVDNTHTTNALLLFNRIFSPSSLALSCLPRPVLRTLFPLSHPLCFRSSVFLCGRCYCAHYPLRMQYFYINPYTYYMEYNMNTASLYTDGFVCRQNGT